MTKRPEAPAIMFVTPGAISPDDKMALADAVKNWMTEIRN